MGHFATQVCTVIPVLEVQNWSNAVLYSLHQRPTTHRDGENVHTLGQTGFLPKWGDSASLGAVWGKDLKKHSLIFNPSLKQIFLQMRF